MGSWKLTQSLIIQAPSPCSRSWNVYTPVLFLGIFNYLTNHTQLIYKMSDRFKGAFFFLFINFLLKKVVLSQKIDLFSLDKELIDV